MSHPLSAWAWALARRLLMLLVRRLLGARLAPWARAMEAEVAATGSEREALAFAWGCLCAALGHALAATRGGLARVHNAGVLSCAAAVSAGCAFMLSAGAPDHYVWMNLLSLALAVATFRLLPRRRLQSDELLRARASFALGALLFIAGWSQASTGDPAWLRLGPVPLNLAWLLLPALLVASDVQPRPAARRWAFGGLLLACSALALQADPLLAALVAVVLGVRACQRRDAVLALLALASSALAAHLGQSWRAPPPLAFVDQVVHHGLEQNWAIGLSLALLQLLPLWPAMRHRQARQHGLVWSLLVALSLPGWLPSPLVGFGGSFIVGYLLSLSVLASDSTEHPAAGAGHAAAPRGQGPPTWPRTGLT
jgi:hypothetical protein